MIRQTKLARDSESITFSRNTDKKPVSWPKALYIELAASVFYTGSGERVYLQFAVMSGSHRADAPCVQIGQDRDGKGSALCGIGACSQFVKEDEGTLIYFF